MATAGQHGVASSHLDCITFLNLDGNHRMLFDRAQLEAALPQYEVGAQLGRGGFGLVLEGRHRRLGRKVAIKILTISEPNVERRFLAEARVMAAFDHPHVVRVHDYAESDGLCLIVMEHLPGGALSARIRRYFPAEQACAIGLAVADAIHAAHQRGIVHRDIKPDNVLFAADGAVKVTDFGIAKLFEGATATTGSMIGTPAYASPEQIAGERIGPPTDVYALGGLLYHLLTGRPPFDLDLPVPAMLHHQLTRRPELPAGMPERLAAVVGQALEKDPSDRPASAKVFALALAEAAVADLGPGWAARSDVPLRIDDDLRNAAAVSGARYSASDSASSPAVTRVKANEESYPGGRVPPGGATITPPEGTPPAWITPPPRGAGGHTYVPAQWNEDPGSGLNSLPPLDGERDPELVPATPNGRATTTSGGRHAAPDPELGNAGGSSGAGYGGRLADRRESASVADLPWGPAPASSGSGQQRALESPSGRHAQVPDSPPAGREREVPPARAALISQLRRAMEAENQEPWWSSRTKLLVAIVVLLVVAAISVAIGVAVGNAHRNSQLSGASVLVPHFSHAALSDA